MISPPQNISTGNTMRSNIAHDPHTSSKLEVTFANNPFWRVISQFPGIKWIVKRIGNFIHGPTYGMTRDQLREYKAAEAKKAQIESIKQEREAMYKAAVYMAVYHPHFYWNKYIDQLEKGTEKRKRAVLLFALANKEYYKVYWGQYKEHFSRLYLELLDMGIDLTKQDIIKGYVKESELLEVISKEKRMFQEIKHSERKTDTSNLVVQPSIVRKWNMCNGDIWS